MSRHHDRIRIAQEICAAAVSYKQNLVGKQFMYVFDDRCIEVIYKRDCFKHLTGVESVLSARRFYQEAVRGHLTAQQIGFSGDHPYQLCCRKLKHLQDIPMLATSECFMLERISTKTRTYKFGSTNLEFTLCMSKPSASQTSMSSSGYVVISLRDEDCFAKSDCVHEVTHIFAKQNTDRLYDTVTYIDPRHSLIDLPAEIRSKVSDSTIAM